MAMTKASDRQGLPKIAALVLAAGQSRRMGTNKLLIDLDGKPLIARVVDAVLASRASPVLVVTGHQDAAVRTALGKRDVTFIANPDFAQGMASSLRAGISSLPAGVDGVVVCLADMPAVDAAVIDALIAAFDPETGAEIIAPDHDGQRGNPVLWGRRLFEDLMQVTGDQGGKALLAANRQALRLVPVDSAGVLLDLDTPEALARFREGQTRQDR
jgi:molybdenum cofactor cytidylyltransferase